MTLAFIYRSLIFVRKFAYIALIFTTTPIVQIRNVSLLEAGPLAQGQTAMEVSVTVWDADKGLLVPKPRLVPLKTCYCLPNTFPNKPSPLPLCMCTPNLYDQSKHCGLKFPTA